jgi:hypothetical protein
MTYTPDQAANSYDSVLSTQPSHSPNDSIEPQTSPTKRSEILRHVLPLSYHSGTSRSRISKSGRYKTQVALSSRSKLRAGSRITFHKYITSLFGNGHEHDPDHHTSQLRSRTSSFGSNPSSSMLGFLPSVDFVSSAAFLFSGPSLQSIRSTNDSTLRLSRHAMSTSETRPVSRQQTDSFSLLDDASVLGDQVLEPMVKRGMRTMTDVLLDTSTPVERLTLDTQDQYTHHDTPPTFCDREVHDASIESPNTYIPGNSARVPIRIAALLLPYLDSAA